jgi:hypothetical protein
MKSDDSAAHQCYTNRSEPLTHILYHFFFFFSTLVYGNNVNVTRTDLKRMF